MKAAFLLIPLMAMTLIGCTDHDDETLRPDSTASAAPEATETVRSVRLGMPIEVEQYTFAKRAEFKDYMEDRIDAVEDAIERFESNSQIGVVDGSGATASKPAPDVAARNDLAVRDLKARHDKVEDKLDGIDDVAEKDWNAFRSQFRQDLIGLERAYQDVLTARK